jgi:FKBP-type peptidyl-prolyl cis-trans isomerase FkpA
MAVLGVAILGAVFLYFYLPRKPKGVKEQFSYKVGVSFAQGLKMQSLDLDSDRVISGVLDGLSGELKLNEAEGQAAINTLAASQQQNKEEDSAHNKAVAEEFLAKNRNADGVKVTKSGLQYKVLKEGSGPSPKPEDKVVVNFKGTFTGDRAFGATPPNQPAEFEVKGVIPGWSEGLQLMKRGGQAILYIPPDLGYGDRANQQIPGNAALILEVELLDVKAAPQAKPSKAPRK